MKQYKPSEKTLQELNFEGCQDAFPIPYLINKEKIYGKIIREKSDFIISIYYYPFAVLGSRWFVLYFMRDIGHRYGDFINIKSKTQLLTLMEVLK